MDSGREDNMSRVHDRRRLLLLLPGFALVAFLTACSRPPEQQLLTQFFRAAKARDNATLAMMSAVEFDPREQGTVEDFSIVSVSPESRRTLGLKALLESERKAKVAEGEFAKRKMEYQTANLPLIEQVVKLERDPSAKLTVAQQAVKAAWDKWREESSAYTRAVSTARSAVATAIGPADASLTQPGQAPFDPTAFEGDLVSKDVVVNASVRSPSGDVSSKTLTITFARASGTLGGTAREGRWILTKIAGA
jgi:hypothetical protein